MPPEASGPVLTVIRPRRIGLLCASANEGSAETLAPAPAAWMNRLRLNVMVLLLCVIGSVCRGGLGSVGLLEGLRFVEGVDFHAFAENPHHRGGASRIDVEEFRAEYLGNEANVRQGGRVPVGKAPGLLLFREVRFQRLERRLRPVREPLVARRLVLAHFALEIPA